MPAACRFFELKDGQMEKLTGILKKAVYILFLAVVAWIFFQAFRMGLRRHRALFPAALVLLFPVLLLAYRRLLPYAERMPAGRQHALVGAAIAAAFCIMIKAGYSLRTDIFETWDYGQLIRTAYGIVRGEGVIDVPYYYARYPNNGMFLLILTTYFRCVSGICGDDIYRYLNATIPLNSLLLALSCLFAYLAVCRLRGRIRGMLTALLMLSALPLYGYAAIAYTDVCGMLPLSLALYFYAHARTARNTAKKIRMTVFAAAASILGYFIKGSVIVITIALFLDLLLENCKIRRKLICGAAGLLACLVCMAAGSEVTDHFLIKYGVSAELMQEEEFPPVHWIMMSLNRKGSGGYMAEDVVYTSSFSGKEEKQKADLKKLLARIERRGLSGTLNHVLNTKVSRMWSSGTFGSEDYLSRKPLTQGIFRNLFSRNGKYIRWYCLITQLWYMALLALMAGNTARAIRQREKDRPVLPELAVMGVFLFHVLWECNNRYVFVFLPALAVCAGAGCSARKNEKTEKI